MNHSSELSANSSGDGEARMSVSKDPSGVLLDQADVETVGRVLSVGQQASLERTLLAANCLGIFGGCWGAAFGVVDGYPAARRGGALMEIFSGTLSILMKVAACTLGVSDGCSTA
jgi:hypothetical protein